nr:MAG TPA: hypothetical protein [Caudoviricetes sp.]DAP20380.1 MAG TPA: hypothetical protein [Caudoviricetes sp.]
MCVYIRTTVLFCKLTKSRKVLVKSPGGGSSP